MNPRQHDGQHIRISGKQPVREALLGGWPVRKIIIRGGPDDEFARDIAERAAALGVEVTVVPSQTFDRKYPRHTQGVVAHVAEVRLRDPDEVLKEVPPGEVPLFVALDGILDPHNLGAITRTALALGVHAVVVPRHRSAAIGEGAVKSSAGAVFREPLCEVPNIHRFIEWAKGKGMWVFGLDAGGKENVWTVDLAGPVALVVGGEDKGLSRLARERCDAVVRIPMSGGIGSLNAGVACAVAVAEAARQRYQKASQRAEKRSIDLR